MWWICIQKCQMLASFQTWSMYTHQKNGDVSLLRKTQQGWCAFLHLSWIRAISEPSICTIQKPPHNITANMCTLKIIFWSKVHYYIHNLREGKNARNHFQIENLLSCWQPKREISADINAARNTLNSEDLETSLNRKNIFKQKRELRA